MLGRENEYGDHSIVIHLLERCVWFQFRESLRHLRCDEQNVNEGQNQGAMGMQTEI